MQTHFMFEKPQRASKRFYGAVSARALSFVIVLHQVMKKLVTSSVPCRCNLQNTILHSMWNIYFVFYFLSLHSCLSSCAAFRYNVVTAQTLNQIK